VELLIELFLGGAREQKLGSNAPPTGTLFSFLSIASMSRHNSLDFRNVPYCCLKLPEVTTGPVRRGVAGAAQATPLFVAL